MLSRLLTVLALTGLGFAAIGDEYLPACKAVEVAISNSSKVYYPGKYDYEQLFGSKAETRAWTGSPLYNKGTYHPTASSQESPACLVEPGTPDDVGKVVRSFLSASLGILRHPR